MQPIPVNRYLVPALPADPPPDATVVEVSLQRGLPESVSLTADTELILTFAAGLASEWREIDTAGTVASTALELDPRGTPGGPEDDVESGRLALSLLRGGRTLAVVSAVFGRQRLVESGDFPAHRFDVWILKADVRAGTLRGPGDFGSVLKLAWRVADRSVDFFAPAPPSPPVVLRMVAIPAVVATPTGVAMLSATDRTLLKKGRLIRWRS